jgi:hypothetical protein
MDGRSRLRPTAASLCGPGTRDGMAGVSRRGRDGRVRADRSMSRGRAEADASAGRQAGLSPRGARRHGRARRPPFGRGGTSNVRGSPARRLEPWRERARPAAEPGGGRGWLETEARMWGGLARAARSDRRVADFPRSRREPRDLFRDQRSGLPERWTAPFREPAPHACCASTLPVGQPGSAPEAEPIPPAVPTAARASPGRSRCPPSQRGGRRARPCCARRGAPAPQCRAAEASASACPRIMERSARPIPSVARRSTLASPVP